MSSATPKPRVECSKPNEHSLRSYDAVPEAVEMTASWKALRSSHKPWKSRARFPHFHRTATATLTLKSTQKGGLPQLPALPLLQAHSSIRKDCSPLPGVATIEILEIRVFILTSFGLRHTIR